MLRDAFETSDLQASLDSDEWTAIEEFKAQFNLGCRVDWIPRGIPICSGYEFGQFAAHPLNQHTATSLNSKARCSIAIVSPSWVPVSPRKQGTE